MNNTAISPRKMPYRPWYLTVLLLTAALTLLPILSSGAQACLLGDSMAEVCMNALQLVLLAGLVLTVLLPGCTWGYRLCVIVLRIWNGLLAAILGVLALAFVALAVIVCLGVLNLPVAALMGGLLLVVTVIMLICTTLIHHTACCMKEAGGSAKAGVWQSIRGHQGPVPALAWGMTAISALLLVGVIICAAASTRTGVLTAYHMCFDALYKTVPEAARTMIRTLRKTLEPLLTTSWQQVASQAVVMLRYAAVGMLYLDYRRLHR